MRYKKQKYPDDGSFDFQYEDLALDDTDNLYCGEVTIDWKHDCDDPSVGYRGGFSFEVTTATIQIPINNEFVVDPKSRLFEAIAEAIEKDPAMLDVVERHAELAGDGW